MDQHPPPHNVLKFTILVLTIGISLTTGAFALFDLKGEAKERVGQLRDETKDYFTYFKGRLDRIEEKLDEIKKN